MNTAQKVLLLGVLVLFSERSIACYRSVVKEDSYFLDRYVKTAFSTTLSCLCAENDLLVTGGCYVGGALVIKGTIPVYHGSREGWQCNLHNENSESTSTAYVRVYCRTQPG
jgi:hypothetical protein